MKTANVAEASFEPVTGGRYRVAGELGFSTVTALLDASRDAFESDASNLDIDLAAVTRADSAGLALLIEWSRFARAAGKTVAFHEVPEQLRAIARVSDLAELLPVAAKAESVTQP